MKRTLYCGELRAQNIGQEVNLFGWVHSRRDHGGVIFIDLRDREGLAQIVFSPEQKDLFVQAEKLRPEYVIHINGSVRHRPEGTVNPNLPTGEVEVLAQNLETLNASKVPPFEISEHIQVSEELRLKYRYIDLRRAKLRNNLILRNEVTRIMRSYLHDKKFLEIETPFLTKSTPEGARDFLVPARLSPGSFYALPQSPQLFKQILMVSGFDRYFQVARCFRDEDLRSDRQLEFTQLDLEMSFIEESDIYELMEGMVKQIFDHLKIPIQIPFLKMSYDESMLRYGNDKPDLRFGMEIEDVTDLVKGAGFKVFAGVAASGGVIRGLNFSSEKKLSRQNIADLTEFVAKYGAKGLAWIEVKESGYESAITKFFKPEELEAVGKKLRAKPGDFLFFVADKPAVAAAALGALRLHLAEKGGLIDKSKNEFKFLWIVDFPLFEYSAEEKRLVARHHPFTSPRLEDIPLLETSPEKAYARAYDLVLNGTEIGGGSIRIHRQDVQALIFKTLKLTEEETKARFGFFLEALDYGAPPHGGIALGLDRTIAILSGEESIREVIAFPKTQKGTCPLTGGPDTVKDKQLQELHIRTVTAVPHEKKNDPLPQ